MSLLRRVFGLDLAAHMERADRYETAGKLGLAKLELEQALDVAATERPGDMEAIRSRIDELASKEISDAEERAQQAIDSGDVRKARYYINVALSKVDAGSAAYNKLIIQKNSLPDDSETERLESELATALRGDTGVDFVDRQRTLEFWKSGFPPYKEEYYFNKALTSELVLAQCEQVEKNPDDVDARFNFGVTLAQLGLIDTALDQLRRFTELRPEDRDGHYFLANLLADQGFDHEAIAEFERTIELDPSFVEARFYLGKHYLNLGDELRAEKLFTQIVKQDPLNDLAEEAGSLLQEIRRHSAADLQPG